MIASGYVQGEKLIQQMKKQAQDLDNSTNATEKVKQALEISISKCKEIDENYKFTETFSFLKDKAYETTSNVYKGVDENLGISTKAKEVKDFTVKTVSDISEKALSYEPVKQSVDLVSSFASSSWNFVKDSWSFFTEETSDQIKIQKQTEQMKEKTQEKKEIVVQEVKMEEKFEEKPEEKIEEKIEEKSEEKPEEKKELLIDFEKQE